MPTIQGRKVITTRSEVANFNRQWPCSELRSTRHYWFEFDEEGDLVDTDVPEQDDGPAASAMATDCLNYLVDGIEADWMEFYDE